MDKAGIATSIITPPTGFAERTDPEKRVGMIRTGQRIRRKAGDGSSRTAICKLVYMPLPDVDAALKEIEYGFSALNVGRRRLRHKLRHEICQRSFLHADLGRAEQAQGDRLFPSAGAARAAPAYFRRFPEEAQLVGKFPTTRRAPSSGCCFERPFRQIPRHQMGVLRIPAARVPMFAGRFNRLTQTSDLSKSRAERASMRNSRGSITRPPTPTRRRPMAALMKFAPLGQILFGSDHPYVHGF